MARLLMTPEEKELRRRNVRLGLILGAVAVLLFLSAMVRWVL